MQGTRRLAGMVVVVCALAAVFAGRAAAAELPSTPDATVDVNVVFIGFEERQFGGHEQDPHDSQAIYSDVLEPAFLPRRNDPIIRIAEITPANPLLSADHHLRFRHHVRVAPKRLEDDLFEFLTRIGRSAPRTRWQELYNAERTNVVDVPEQILEIPGPEVERWLLRNARTLPGLDPNAHTIVFINWFGKPGFKFHVYRGTGVDPDTGRDNSKIDIGGSAFGGSAGRLWFYDMSAGPQILNWFIDDNQIGGLCCFIPPIWEMRADPSGRFSDATTAAGLLARYSLYTQATGSPIYDPLTSAPRRGGSRVIRLNLFDGNPSVPQSAYLTPDYVTASHKDLQPYFDVSASLTRRPLEGEDRTSFETFAGALSELAGIPAPPPAPGCWENYGTPVAQSFCYVREHEDLFRTPAAPRDHVIPAMLYNVDEATGEIYRAGLGGYAGHDDHAKPYEVYSAADPRLLQTANALQPGYGQSSILTHELGHHAGLSHNHDGYDSEVGGADFAPNTEGLWLFNLGECKCGMSYIFNAPGWGVFDHDSADRTLAARYYATAYRTLGQLPPTVASRVQADLRTSLAAFRQLNYRTAVLSARDAYERALDALGPAAAERLAAPVGKRPGPPGRPKPHPSTIDTPDGKTPAPGRGRARPSGEERQLRLPPSPVRERYLQQSGG